MSLYWKGTQTDSGISVRHSCQKTSESIVEIGQQAKQSEIKLLIQENRTPQDLIVDTDGSVTKDQGPVSEASLSSKV